MKSQNKETGDKAELLVMNYFKRRGINAEKANHGKGYDIKAGKLFIEVKGTELKPEKKNFFHLSEEEFMCACRNKNFYIYWVNTKSRKIFKKIPRNQVLENAEAKIQYKLPLSKIKRE